MTYIKKLENELNGIIISEYNKKSPITMSDIDIITKSKMISNRHNLKINKDRLQNNFNMFTITLEFGLSIDIIRDILLAKYPKNSSKRELLTKAINSVDLKERITYPGGYNGFIENYNNGIYNGIID